MKSAEVSHIIIYKKSHFHISRLLGWTIADFGHTLALIEPKLTE